MNLIYSKYIKNLQKEYCQTTKNSNTFKGQHKKVKVFISTTHKHIIYKVEDKLFSQNNIINTKKHFEYSLTVGQLRWQDFP